MRASWALAGLCFLACSPAQTPPVDGSTTDAMDGSIEDTIDANTAPSVTLRTEDSLVRVALSAGPLGLRVDRSDGTSWLRSPENAPFLEVGTFPGGPSTTRFHDVRQSNPSGIRWNTPSVVRAGATEQNVELEAGNAGPVRVQLERVEAGIVRISINATGSDAALLRLHFATNDGGYHGLGERFGAADARGSIVPMQLHPGGTASGTNEIHAPVPFFVHTSGYGVFVETREAGAFDVASTDRSRVSATFEGKSLRVWLFFDPSPRAVIAKYTRATGLPRLPPFWSFAPQHWRNEWRSRTELFEDARRIRSEHIPNTTFWIDNPWQQTYNDHEIDATRFPDPQGMLRELNTLGYRVLFWSTPYLDAVAQGAQPTNTAERLWSMARDNGWLVRGADGTPFVSPAGFFSPSGMSDAYGTLVDFSAEAASRFWTDRLETLVRSGARAFKLDYAEDILVEAGGSRPGYRFANGSSERTEHSFYPQRYHRAYRDALDRFANGDGFVMGRASSWGGQSVVDVLWPGDLDNDFRPHGNGQVGGLPAAINGMLSLAASGFPSFASDTGGYRGGKPTREVLLRWAEHTALSPFMQLGGGGESHNPWSYTPDATTEYRALARLHTDLVPYFFENAQRASREGIPAVNHIALVYPEDPAARSETAEYLLGNDLLVAPVIVVGATSRRVHFPPGRWVHWFRNTVHMGPSDLEISAPIGTPPLFLREGALVPMLASDVETLIATDDPSIVDVEDRRSIARIRAVPGMRSMHSLRDGTMIESAAVSATEVSVRWTAGSAVQELRGEVSLAHLLPMDRGVQTVVGAGSPAMDETRCGTCWRYDAERKMLFFSVRGSSEVRVSW